MCLALPARVIEVDQDGQTALVELDGIRKRISLVLIEEVAVDDFLLIHVGYALNKLSEDEARRTLALFAQAGMIGSSA
ncbi:MAG: HypC/HybG/HupF family hydrogenase formation chaperone [Gammaproteobacteria bacterium]|nr:HypC/HybG/HupF family hydrogenase formation chaperone [Gammaproteobacteria bacterium]MCP5418395.1 HypC/HybG/HupF family hydrogenase formation chaperone [Chromatiaceae bacterium]